MGDGHTDILESGPERPPRRTALVLVAVIVAAAAGYLAGGRRGTPATPAPSAAPVEIQPIAATGKRCSVQLGDRLQLGVEIGNRSATGVTLQRVEEILPLGGLRPTAGTWGGCGELSAPAGGDQALPAGATTWVTITFDVLVACPAPLPVLFAVRFTQEGRPGITELPGFADLGDVPYTSTKCRDS